MINNQRQRGQKSVTIRNVEITKRNSYVTKRNLFDLKRTYLIKKDIGI